MIIKEKSMSAKVIDNYVLDVLICVECEYVDEICVVSIFEADARN